MAVFFEKRMVLAIKAETTEGTYNAPAGADAEVLIEDVKFEAGIAQFPRNPNRADLSTFPSIPGSQMAKMTFKAELKGSGAAGTAAKLGKLLKLCGFGETVNAGVSVVYAPISIAVPAFSLDAYTVPESGNNLKASIRGARGTFKMSPKVGEPSYIEVDVQGVYNGVTDVAGITATGLDTTLPPALLNAAFTVQGFSPKISQFSLDMANALVMRQDISKAEGFFSCVIATRDPKGSMDPERELVVTHDYYGKVISAALGTLSVAIGGTASNICTITAPKLQYTKVSEGTRGPFAVWNVDFKLNRNSLNDELVFTFT